MKNHHPWIFCDIDQIIIFVKFSIDATILLSKIYAKQCILTIGYTGIKEYSTLII